MKVLIVGDMDASPSSATALVRARGHQVVSAPDGLQGLVLLERERPALVLLDSGLSRPDAYETARAMRQQACEAWFPIVFLAHGEEARVAALALEAGGDDCLGSPVTPALLQAKLGMAERLAELRGRLEAVGNELERADRELLRQSLLDGLTGVANRRHLDNTLAREWRRALRTQQPLALLVIDLDHFKQYNRGYGHERGDECLRLVASVLAEGLHRPADVLARLSGDAFAVVLPETDEAGAAELARRLIERVREAQLPHGRSPVADFVTVSIGCAAGVPAAEAQAESLLARARAALREAKRWGRNRCVRGSELDDTVAA